MQIPAAETLHYQDRCLRTLPGKLLFGPAGDRLCVDILDKLPGFSGSIDFIHKMNMTRLFSVECGNEASFAQMETTWYPTHMTATLDDELLLFAEKKTIVADDVALSLMRFENRDTQPLTLAFVTLPDGFAEVVEGAADGCFGRYSESPALRFGIRLGIAAAWNMAEASVTIAPGAAVDIVAVAAVGNLLGEPPEAIREKAAAYLKQAESEGAEALFARLIAENDRYYAEAPQFLCDDKLINACWRYRWYILKNTMCRPKMGRFAEMVMYEGRDHRMSKRALAPSGWEFSKLIPLSTPLQVNDLRWHPDHALTREIIRSAFAAQDEDGILLTAYVDEARKSYANYMLWAIWLFYLVDGDRMFVRALVPQMAHYIAGHEAAYGNPADSLLVEHTHSLTGKEYQPSYWYFSGFPPNPKDKAGFTPLKRVDRSVYHYLNLLGLANLLDALGDPQSGIYREKAQRLRGDILHKMWDADTGFFYDLHHETDEKAMVRNIVGIYPFWAEMTGAEHGRGILLLMDDEAFATGSAFASVSKDCPVFSPAGGWMGNYFKGRNGCVWCGPSWPYTTGIALSALAMESRKYGHRYDAEFTRFFNEYTAEHFRDGDRSKPYLVEHYNAVTGEPLSDEADYNHSYWLDIAVRYVAGLEVLPDAIEVAPLRTHLRWFTLQGVVVRGHAVSVAFSRTQNPHGIPVGLTVTVDGEAVFSGEGWVRIAI